MQKVTFYQIKKNSDRIDGRGPMVPLNIGFVDKHSALSFVKSSHYAYNYGVGGAFGSEYNIVETTINIYESFAEWDKLSPRETALAKLTSDERTLLGL